LVGGRPKSCLKLAVCSRTTIVDTVASWEGAWGMGGCGGGGKSVSQSNKPSDGQRLPRLVHGQGSGKLKAIACTLNTETLPHVHWEYVLLAYSLVVVIIQSTPFAAPR
jgi:hypothetical protein